MQRLREWWHAFVAWSRQRPFIGGLLTVLGGVEMFFSGQLSVGAMRVQVGIEGFQAMIIPIVLVVLGVLATLMPQHRIFYGVIALVVAVYSLVGVNLGGFFAGMILASVGGVLIVSWMPRGPDKAADTTADADRDAPAAERGRRRRGGDTARRASGGALAVALTAAMSLGLVAAHPQSASAAVPETEASGVCILGFIGDCSNPSPTPRPTPTSTSTTAPGTPSTPAPSPSPGSANGTGGAATPPAPTGPTLIAPASDSPVFTGKPALLQGSSLSFSGLRYLGLATVRLSDGSTATVLKLSMDSVTIPGFRLDTRDANGAGTDTVATSMSFSGGVNTYLASFKAVLDNGKAVQYDIQHPPSSDGSVPVLRILSLEVFGITGGSSALTGFHEMIS
ncbi:hypothetical protein GCM10027414_20960 [Humibacter ginsengiterrae]